MSNLITGLTLDELRAARQGGATILANEGRHGRPDTYHVCADPQFTCEPNEYAAVVPWCPTAPVPGVSVSAFNYQAQSDLFDAGVRIGTVIHVKGATIDAESPSEAMERFIDDEAQASYVLAAFEPVWPGYISVIESAVKARAEEEEEGGRRSAQRMYQCEVADFFARRCPKQFIVAVEYQIQNCIQADPKGEGLGTWGSGWGYYGTLWMLADDVAEAALAGLQRAKEFARVEWQKAVDEGRVRREVARG